MIKILDSSKSKSHWDRKLEGRLQEITTSFNNTDLTKAILSVAQKYGSKAIYGEYAGLVGLEALNCVNLGVSGILEYTSDMDAAIATAKFTIDSFDSVQPLKSIMYHLCLIADTSGNARVIKRIVDGTFTEKEYGTRGIVEVVATIKDIACLYLSHRDHTRDPTQNLDKVTNIINGLAEDHVKNIAAKYRDDDILETCVMYTLGQVAGLNMEKLRVFAEALLKAEKDEIRYAFERYGGGYSDESITAGAAPLVNIALSEEGSNFVETELTKYLSSGKKERPSESLEPK